MINFQENSANLFTDLPHVQDDEGVTLAEIQQLYRIGGLAAVWARIK